MSKELDSSQIFIELPVGTATLLPAVSHTINRAPTTSLRHFLLASSALVDGVYTNHQPTSGQFFIYNGSYKEASRQSLFSKL